MGLPDFLASSRDDPHRSSSAAPPAIDASRTPAITLFMAPPSSGGSQFSLHPEVPEGPEKSTGKMKSSRENSERDEGGHISNSLKFAPTDGGSCRPCRGGGPNPD